MKKKCIMFGNCQCVGIYKFLTLCSNFNDLYDTTIYANWEMIASNESIPSNQLKEADLIIFQPLTDIHGCYSTNKENPNSFFNLLKKDCQYISFPRLHNNALFPIFKKAANKNIFYGNVNNKETKYTNIEQLLLDYSTNKIDFMFKERLENNYLISKKKEEDCNIKIIDFIYENIKKHKLFLTHDHPTSFVFNEVSRQIAELLNIPYDFQKGFDQDENITGLQDSVYSFKNCQYPISRYSIDYFKFEYIKVEDTEADEFYKNNLIEWYYKNS